MPSFQTPSHPTLLSDMPHPQQESNVPHKKPCKKAETLAYSVQQRSIPNKELTGRSPSQEVLFGAFRDSFDTRAEEARETIMSNATDLKNLTIKKAAAEWLKLREMYVQPGTIRAYEDYIARLNIFFGEMLVGQIHIGHFQEYQRLFKGRYHPASINHDLNTLSQILRKAGLWQPIAEHYRSLPVPRQPKPRVLTDKQENDFFELAASDRRWYLAYLEASLSNNTTAYGVELRLMQLSDIDMEAEPPTITVPLNVKNEHRPRVIPLNERGRIMVMGMLDRAKSLGASRLEHYLFPFRIKRGLHDPSRPASPSWTNWQWNALNRRALELKIIPFRVTRRNFRNQPITKMLEAGVPIETVRAVAGHVSDEMTRYYAQHRLTVKADALSLIDPERKKRPSGIFTRGRKGASA